MKKVLVVAAHPDDEVLGCGGTIARQVREGAKVRFVICGEGLTSRRGVSDIDLAALDYDLRQASGILGVKDVVHLEWPDNRFDSRDLLDLVHQLEEQALPFSPNLIITHHHGDLNIDHRLVHEAVMTCFRPLPGGQPHTILAMAVPSSTGWAAPEVKNAFLPNAFSDISETLKTKIAAMQAYRTERAQWPHPRSPEALHAWAQYWGSQVGVPAAEPFMLLRGFL